MAEETQSTDVQPPVVERFTDQQERELSDLIAHFIQPARSRSMDRRAVTFAAQTVKRTSEENKKILWCASPWQVITMHAILALWAMGGVTLADSLRAQLKEEPWKSMFDSLYSQMQDGFLSDDELTDFAKTEKLEYDSIGGVALRQAKLLDKLGAKLSAQLSWSAKLSLREQFNQDAPQVRALGRAANLIRLPLGFPKLSSFLVEDPSASFGQLISEETKTQIEELCNRFDLKRLGPFGLPSTLTPLKYLFEFYEGQGFAYPTVINQILATHFIEKRYPVKVDADEMRQVTAWYELAENVFHFSWSGKFWVACEPPTQAHIDESFMLHSETGAALVFRDGTEVYAHHGVVIPKNAVGAIDTITMDEIDKEQNVEVRRLLIQRYGEIRYLQDSNAVEIDSDQYGTLFRKSFTGDEPMVMVRVKNSTPEPDGTFKHYFLRVPPYMTTARAAVAWTFNMKPEEYNPLQQT